jgi:SAM-dependent methyltransferase
LAHHVQSVPGVFDTELVVPDDAAFDRRLPVRLQLRSSTFFTPVEVSVRAARLLTPQAGLTVLDVGAGAGKFCITAALAVPTCEFVGIEWRPHLVELATALAKEHGVQNARFIHGDALELDWSAFDAFYFFNPFAEQLLDGGLVLDNTIEHEPTGFSTSVARARRKLSHARVGARVVTYHGFGSALPLGYELFQSEPIESDRLDVWIKVRSIVGSDAPGAEE